MATSLTFTTLTNAGNQCLRVYVSNTGKEDGNAPHFDLGPATGGEGECADNQYTVPVSIRPGALLVIGRPARDPNSWFDNTQWFPIENYTANTVLTPPANNNGPPPQMLFLDVNKKTITVGTTVAPPGFYDPPAPPGPPSPVDPSGSGGEYPYEPLPQPSSGIASWSQTKLWAVFGGISAGIVILVLVIVLPVMLVKKTPGSGGGGNGNSD
jgi:hypothetical protein